SRARLGRGAPEATAAPAAPGGRWAGRAELREAAMAAGLAPAPESSQFGQSRSQTRRSTTTLRPTARRVGPRARLETLARGPPTTARATHSGGMAVTVGATRESRRRAPSA